MNEERSVLRVIQRLINVLQRIEASPEVTRELALAQQELSQLWGRLPVDNARVAELEAKSNASRMQGYVP